MEPGTDGQLLCARNGETGQMAKAEAKTLDSSLLKRDCLFWGGLYAVSDESGACCVPGTESQPWGFAVGHEHPPHLCLDGAGEADISWIVTQINKQLHVMECVIKGTSAMGVSTMDTWGSLER